MTTVVPTFNASELSTLNTTISSDDGVHPGITTLACCIIILLMLGAYLSTGSITSCMKRIRDRFRCRRDLSQPRNVEMTTQTSNETNKELVSVRINIIKSSSNNPDKLDYNNETNNETQNETHPTSPAFDQKEKNNVGK